MSLKEDIISKLKKEQFSPKVYGKLTDEKWSQKNQIHEHYFLFYNTDQLRYDDKYYKSKGLFFWVEYFKSNGTITIYLEEYAPDKHTNNQKLSNINHFKLGFCNTLISNNYL